MRISAAFYACLLLTGCDPIARSVIEAPLPPPVTEESGVVHFGPDSRQLEQALRIIDMLAKRREVKAGQCWHNFPKKAYASENGRARTQPLGCYAFGVRPGSSSMDRDAFQVLVTRVASNPRVCPAYEELRIEVVDAGFRFAHGPKARQFIEDLKRELEKVREAD